MDEQDAWTPIGLAALVVMRNLRTDDRINFLVVVNKGASQAEAWLAKVARMNWEESARAKVITLAPDQWERCAEGM